MPRLKQGFYFSISGTRADNALKNKIDSQKFAKMIVINHPRVQPTFSHIAANRSCWMLLFYTHQCSRRWMFRLVTRGSAGPDSYIENEQSVLRKPKAQQKFPFNISTFQVFFQPCSAIIEA